MTSSRQNTIVLLGALLTVSAACSPLAFPVSEQTGPRKHTLQVLDTGQTGDRSFDRSPEWIRASYKAVAIRDIHTIPPERFSDYRTYVQRGQVHFIVHPGYFPFFDEWNVTPIRTDYSRGIPRKNLLERVGEALTGSDIAYQVARQQEQITKDFIDHQSRKGSLVILVLPRDYREHLTYGYVPGYDEYARYINEMAGEADNILFIESDSHQSGYLRPEDLTLLGTFLDAVGARSLLLGGGFIGKCLDNFAASLRKRYPYDAIWYVAELTILSPAEIIADRATFLSFWGNLRQDSVRRYLTSIPVNRTTREPLRWADLAFGPPSRYR